jgi:hypothetical protein
VVEPLNKPHGRPLPRGQTWIRDPELTVPWFRIYHRDPHTPSGNHQRVWGPAEDGRFDPHTCSPAGICPDGRSVIYVGRTLSTAAAEAFGLNGADVCPRWHLAELQMGGRMELLDLDGRGAIDIGATPALAVGDVDRELSQEWARAIYEDLTEQGIHYLGARELGEAVALWDGAPTPQVVQWDGDMLDKPVQDPSNWSRVNVAYSGTAPSPLRLLHAIESDDCPKCESHDLPNLAPLPGVA